MKIEFLGLTKDNVEVYLRKGEKDCRVLTSRVTLRQALATIILNDAKFSQHQVHFDYAIGKDKCVSTTPEDRVVLWQPAGQTGRIPMALNRSFEETNILNLTIEYDDGMYFVTKAMTGIEVPKQPWEDELTESERAFSESFWSCHAWVPNMTELHTMKHTGVL